jgi:hypothetical protein
MSIKEKVLKFYEMAEGNAEAILKESVEDVLKFNKCIKTEEQAINFLWEEINNRGL